MISNNVQLTESMYCIQTQNFVITFILCQFGYCASPVTILRNRYSEIDFEAFKELNYSYLAKH